MRLLRGVATLQKSFRLPPAKIHIHSLISLFQDEDDVGYLKNYPLSLWCGTVKELKEMLELRGGPTYLSHISNIRVCWSLILHNHRSVGEMKSGPLFLQLFCTNVSPVNGMLSPEKIKIRLLTLPSAGGGGVIARHCFHQPAFPFGLRPNLDFS